MTGYPDNPVVLRRWRADSIESQHRGAWVVVDETGRVLDGSGAIDHPIFARSSTKSLQALPLVETGAADAYGLTSRDLAIVMASHRAEAVHTETVERILARVELTAEDLRCGIPPRATSTIANECSGKHAGFLVLAAHLGIDPSRYIDPASEGQELVAKAIAEMSGAGDDLSVATDGCSAPTFRLPLAALATAIARLANPEALDPNRASACRRLTVAAGDHPEMIAGSTGRFDTEVMRATNGRLFAKTGADGVHIVGVVGGSRGLAVKIDDGAGDVSFRVMTSLLTRHGLIDRGELDRLERWARSDLTNAAGVSVGRHEVLL